MSDGAPAGGAVERWTERINRLVEGIARHWLFIFNAVWAAFIGLAFLAPALMHAGAEGPANLIYKVYGFTCHQLPERSIFLYGHEHFYSSQALAAGGHLPADMSQLQRILVRWPGSAEAGWKVALCQRDVAIYTSVFLSGLLFGALRPRLLRRGPLPKMKLWMLALLLAPAAVDGLTQLPGWRESVPALRFFTGALAGAAGVWAAYPHIDEAMADAARPLNDSQARIGQP